MQKQYDFIRTPVEDCQQCPRLYNFLQELKKKYPKYHNRAVPAFGAENPDLLIVGLAPGMHGANASGRPFTGDFAGILLYKTLYEFRFSNKFESLHNNDGLMLDRVRITNAVKCLPPQNKPVSTEINTCNGFLTEELQTLKPSAVILALGTIAHKSVIKALKLKQKDYKFSHNTAHPLPDDRYMVDSYHCSRYNTQTRRLTEQGFREVFHNIKNLIEQQ